MYGDRFRIHNLHDSVQATYLKNCIRDFKIFFYNKYFKFPYFLTKIYVMGSQKNRLNEKFLLNTQIVCL